MIVLDEQLLGRAIEHTIKTWYRGRVIFITELRPNTVIKDDAISFLLSQQRQPTFVTINESDFWQRIAINPRFCCACFALPDSRAGLVPDLLKRLFQHPQFRTKAGRMGTVLRISPTVGAYYTWLDRTVRSLGW